MSTHNELHMVEKMKVIREHFEKIKSECPTDHKNAAKSEKGLIDCPDCGCSWRDE